MNKSSYGFLANDESQTYLDYLAVVQTNFDFSKNPLRIHELKVKVPRKR